MSDHIQRNKSDPVTPQYSLPPGAWVEHGTGWVKVHGLSSPEAVTSLRSFLAGLTP